ncbi:MAG: WG repeat-containing protein [Syntrophomonadaceae bacterium]|nr:WG repeat-containing protein [Syntrophomonadaceae bacterium]
MIKNKWLKLAILLALAALLVIAPVAREAEAETQGQELVRESGLSVQWLKPGISYKSIDLGVHSEGACAIDITLPDNTVKCGFIDAKGGVIAPFIYDQAGWFSEGLCYVVAGSTKAFIDRAGREVLDVSGYDHVQAFRGGFAVAQADGQKGLIDKTGREVLPCAYDEVFNHESGLLWARQDGRYGFFDRDGQALTGMIYDDIGHDGYVNSATLFAVEKDGKYGVVNHQGAEVTPIIYTNAIVASDDIMALNEHGKWGYVTAAGASVTPFQFDHAEEFREGMAIVFMNEKYGYINERGELVVPCKYDSAWDFDQGIASVAEIVEGEHRFYLIDQTGQVIVPRKDYPVVARGDALIGQYDPYAGVPQWFGAPSFMEALLDHQGNRLTGFWYTGVTEFTDGLAVAAKYGTSLYGLINRYGAEVTPFIFSQIEFLNGDTCLVKVHDSDYSNHHIGVMTLPADAATRKPAAPRPITVYLDGMDLYFDTEPIIANDRTMVPMRKIFESLGFAVTWDDAARKVTGIRGGATVELSIGSATAFIDRAAFPLDAPALIENGRTLVPLRLVAESLGCDVTWDPDMRRVNIATDALFGGGGTEDDARPPVVPAPPDEPADEFSIHDPAGYVSIGQLQSVLMDAGEYKLTGGTIRINKDLDGKLINVFGIERQDGIIVTTMDGQEHQVNFLSPIFIDDEYARPLQAGDIRAFTTPYDYDTVAYSASNEFVVRVTEPLVESFLEPFRIPSRPLYFTGELLCRPDAEVKAGQPIYIGYSIGSVGDDSIIADPFEIIFNFYRYVENDSVSAQEPATEMIYTTALPAFDGEFSGGGQVYSGVKLWDKKDLNGNIIGPGQYRYEFILPEITYTVKGTNERGSQQLAAPLGGAFNGGFEIFE